MEFLQFLITPILGGLIALFTNWIAIRMLFRPHYEKRIFGIKLPFTPGLIPKERTAITRKLAEAISTRILSPDVLIEELSDMSNWNLPDITVADALKSFGIKDPAEVTGEKLQQVLRAVLPKLIDNIKNFDETFPEADAKLRNFTATVIDKNVGSFAGMFINRDKMYEKLKTGISEYITNPANKEQMENSISEFIDSFLQNDAVKKVFEEKILSFNIKDALITNTNGETPIKNILRVLAGLLAENMPIQAMITNKMDKFRVDEAEEIILNVAGRELRAIVMLGGVLGFFIGMLANFL